jgi:hypothetical protein
MGHRQRARAFTGAVLISVAAMVPAHAALVTIVGTNFDVIYDDTSLGLFGAPTLVGDTLFFTPNTFRAQSLNGDGAVATNSTLSGLRLIAKNGYQFGAFDLAEFGDYRLSGAGSFVTVNGQLRAFNPALSTTTQTTSNLAVSGSTPLTTIDGGLYNWLATARIDQSTPPVGGLPLPFPPVQNVIASRPTEVVLTIENLLLAYTDPQGTGFREAFIEKKFVGTGVSLEVTPIPLPPAAALMVVGLASLGLLRRRRIG